MSVNATTGSGPLPIENFILSFVATLLGVFIAFFLTLQHDRRKKAAQEKETQRRIIVAIQSELQSNLGEGNQIVRTYGNPSGIVVVFRTAAYQSAIGGGDLSLLKPEIQNALSNIYTGFRMVERIAEKMISMLGTETAFQTWGKYRDDVNKMLVDGAKELQSSIPKTDQLLKDELKRLGK